MSWVFAYDSGCRGCCVCFVPTSSSLPQLRAINVLVRPASRSRPYPPHWLSLSQSGFSPRYSSFDFSSFRLRTKALFFRIEFRNLCSCCTTEEDRARRRSSDEEAPYLHYLNNLPFIMGRMLNSAHSSLT